MKKIQRIGPKSFAKVFGVLYALMGFIIGIPVLLLSLFREEGVEASGIGALLLGTFAPLIIAVVYGLLGVIFGFIGAWLYNIASRWVGGIEIETEDTSPPATP